MNKFGAQKFKKWYVTLFGNISKSDILHNTSIKDTDTSVVMLEVPGNPATLGV